MASTITSHGIHYHFLHSPPKKPLHFHLPFSSLKPSFTSPPIFSTSTLKTPPSTPHHFHFYPSFLPPLSAIHRGNSVISPPKDSTFEEHQQQPLKTLLWVVFWASVSLAVYAFSSDSKASAAVAAAVSFSGDSSIKASSFGLRVAAALRGFGWSDEAVVVCVAALPVLELRGAIPVGYWMQLNPLLLTLLAVFGNMLPVPFIILYLKKLATFIAGKSRTLSKLLDMLFERAKNKAGPIEEFQWLGLMLFVAVPFPGTGAWTGAIIASVLDMPFWPAVSANFFGVVLAGLLVNLLVNLGLKYAVITGVVLFFVSTFMWSVLRSLRKPLTSTK